MKTDETNFDYWTYDDWRVNLPDGNSEPGFIVDFSTSAKLRMVMIFLFDSILREVLICLQNKLELSSILLCLASVDYLAGYFAGKKSDRTDFIRFMDHYFPDQYKPYNEIIYAQIRSGLFHNLVTYNPFTKGRIFPITINISESNHLETKDGKLLFSVSRFFVDIQKAFMRYKQELLGSDSESEIVINFHRRFNKLGGSGSVMIRIPE